MRVTRALHYAQLAEYLATNWPPVLRPVSSEGRAFNTDVESINELFWACFDPTHELGDAFGLEQLNETVAHNRDCWMVKKKGREVVAFAHVEPIRGVKAEEHRGTEQQGLRYRETPTSTGGSGWRKRAAGDALRWGLIHEGDIKPDDVLQDTQMAAGDYIHIGCIAAKGSHPRSLAKNLNDILHAVSVRALVLAHKASWQTSVLAVNYPDHAGRFRSAPYLRDFGFCCTGRETRLDKRNGVNERYEVWEYDVQRHRPQAEHLWEQARKSQQHLQSEAEFTVVVCRALAIALMLTPFLNSVVSGDPLVDVLEPGKVLQFSAGAALQWLATRAKTLGP